MDDQNNESPTLALVRLARVAELEVARILEPHGLTLRRHRMLQLIAATPGLSHASLARATKVELAGIPSSVRSLVGAGLAREKTEGGIAGSLSITATGSELLHRLDAEFALVDSALFDTAELQEVARAVVGASARPPAEPVD